jgi:hypothetical protein
MFAVLPKAVWDRVSDAEVPAIDAPEGSMVVV